MSFVRCYDVVSMVTDEADKQFGAMWKINRDKQSLLEDCCDMIDELAQEFGGVSYDVDVDDITMDISVQLVCGDITIKSEEHKLYRLVQHTKSFGFSAAEDNESMCVTFVFAGIWDKAI